MADNPVIKILRAARQGKAITLTSTETKLLAVALMNAAKRLRKGRHWWRRG